MKYLAYSGLFVVALALFGVTPLFAQEEMEDTMSETMMEGEASMEGSMDGEMYDDDSVVGTDEDGSLTQEEYEELVEEAEEVTEDTLESEELIEGEVVAVNEEEGVVIIETPEGELVSITTEAASAVQVRKTGGAGKLLNAKPNQKVILVPKDATSAAATVEVSGGTTSLVLPSESGETKVAVTAETPVYKNGERVAMATLKADDKVNVIQSPEGEVLAVEILSDDAEAMEVVEVDETDTSTDDEEMPWVWIALVVAVLAIGGWFMFGRRS